MKFSFQKNCFSLLYDNNKFNKKKTRKRIRSFFMLGQEYERLKSCGLKSNTFFLKIIYFYFHYASYRLSKIVVTP